MAKYNFLNVVVTSEASASLMLYGQIGGEDGVSAEQVNAELLYLQQDYPNIDVHINSIGGEVFAGIAIYNALRASKSNIKIYVDGLAASIAGVIALCGKPLYMSYYSRLMLHQVSGACKGGARDMRTYADQIESLENSLAEMISAKCDMTPDAVKAEFFDGSDHWMTAEEARRRGLCDSIYDLPGQEQLRGPVMPTAEAIYAFANSLKQTPSNTNKMDFFNELKKESSFQNLSEEQSLAQIRTLANEAAKVPALQAKIDELTGKLNEANASAIEAYLNQAVSDGRISQEQVESYTALMKADAENTRKIVDSLPKKGQAPSIQELLNHAGKGSAAGASGDLKDMTWDQIDKAERLAELKDKYPDLYAAKYREKFGE